MKLAVLRMTLAVMVCCSQMSVASDFSLRKASIAIDAEEASFVHCATGELCQQIKKAAGESPVLCYDLDEARQIGECVIVIGRAMADRLREECPSAVTVTDHEPGEQGFIIQSLRLSDGEKVILSTGSDSSGTNYSVIHLRQLLIESKSGATLSDSVCIVEKPRYRKRGLYLHQHWRYNNPYAVWSWSVEDWKRALDMAASMRVNLVLMWPHMDMMSPPLSVAEQDYLADIKEVIDYAHRKRGIEIWTIEAPNMVIDEPDARRLPLDRRNYYAYHSMGSGLKNPGDPSDLAKMLANREAFYRMVPNAGGYGFIDSDPGGWNGSPSSEFVDLFVKNRELLDRTVERPEQAKLLYWLYNGWGNGDPADVNWRSVVGELKSRLKEPWELMVCYNPTMAPHAQNLVPQPKIAEEFGLLDKTVFFNYQVVDGEPSFPFTRLNFPGIDATYDWVADYKGLNGVMCNVQTFLLQLPNIHYFTQCAWSLDTHKNGQEASLRSLANMLFPDNADLLVSAWRQLSKPGSESALTISAQIEDLAAHDGCGRLGIMGRYVFPRPSQVLGDLAIQLRVHGKAEHVREVVAAQHPSNDVIQAVTAYLEAVLEWQRRNGHFGAYSDKESKTLVYNMFSQDPPSQVVIKSLRQFLKGRSDQASLRLQVDANVSKSGYAVWIKDAYLNALFGNP